MIKTLQLLLCLFFVLTVAAQKSTISGTGINGANKEPIPGVTVQAKGSGVSVASDNAGKFSINVGPDVKELEVSSIGFSTKTVSITSDNLLIEMTIQRKDDAEVVVVAYGQMKKRDVSGSIVSVKGAELKKVPSGNVMESLQGKMPGVDVTRTSGSAGANSKVVVRGNRSITANNDPLYIVDGVQYSNFQDINANDILSMEVLKDASSTAIYGSRGANGVIIITTKKGANGEAKVSVGASYGITEVVGYPQVMNGPEYVAFKREAYRTTGVTKDSAFFTNPGDFPAIKNNTSFDWPSAMLHKGSQQDYSINVSGGNEKTRAFLSYGFFQEKGILRYDVSNRHTIRLNVEQAITSRIKVGLQNQLTVYDQNLRNDNVLTQATKVIPMYTPYNADGTLVRFPGNANQFNPLYNDVKDAYVNDNKINRLLTSGFLEFKFTKNFSLRSNIGFTYGTLRNGTFADANTIGRSNSTGSFSQMSNTKSTELLWENILNWSTTIGEDHQIGITGVSSYLKNITDNFSASGTGQLFADQLYYFLQDNNANLAINSNYIKSNLISGAFRVNYSFNKKYILNFTGRSDGSSVLGSKNQWAFFPSASIAWRVIDEPFMNKVTSLSDLKFRVSYGIAGSSAVQPYSSANSVSLIPFSWNDVQVQAYRLSPRQGNNQLRWELTGTTNIGVDFGLFQQRVTGSIDVYDSRTKDLLLARSLPTTTGFQSVVENIAKTRNRGIEISVQGVILNRKKFNWSAAVNFTKNKEEIVQLTGASKSDLANSWFVGSPVATFYDFEKIGIWQTADSATARAYGQKPGDIRVRDVNNDKKISINDDRVILGYGVPKFILGVNQDIKIGAFDFNVYVFTRQGQMFVSAYANKFESNAIENGAKVNYWTPENPTNDYPRPNASLSRAALPYATTLGYKDGSFIKIRNISVGYTLPSSFSKQMHVSKVRLYLSARNYFVFSKVKDYDPEGGGSFESPLTKLLLGGLSLDF